MSGVQHIEIKAQDVGMRLDRWFANKYPGLGFGRLQKLLRKGDVRVNGKRAKTNDRLAQDDIVRVPPLDNEQQAPAPRPERELTSEDRDFVRSLVMHEDKALFVLNKPSGLAVQGGTGTHRHLDGLLPGLVSRSGERPKLVHRLDRDTAGICVIAKTDQAARALTHAFRARDAKKTYWALTVGVPPMSEGEILAALAKRGTAGNEKMEVVDRHDTDAKRALTMFEIVDRAAMKAAWVALRPITGRTHQLRIHLAHMGMPIQGDSKYADGACLEGVDKTMHLYARSLDIAHPMGGRLNAVAPMPDHMAKSWRFFGFLEHEGDNAFAEMDNQK